MSVTLDEDELETLRWYFTPPPPHEIDEMAEIGEEDDPEGVRRLFRKLGLEGWSKEES